MNYVVEINSEEHAFITACTLGVVRRAQEKMKTQDAINVTTVAAGCIKRLNEARLTHHDVYFFNSCILKTRDLLMTDSGLPKGQKRAALAQCNALIQKLDGVGAPVHIATPS